MATQAQQVFRQIVTFNKLMNDRDLDFYLSEEPDPEKLIPRLVQAKVLNQETAGKLIAVYRRKLESPAGKPPENKPAAAPPADGSTKPSTTPPAAANPQNVPAPVNAATRPPAAPAQAAPPVQKAEPAGSAPRELIAVNVDVSARGAGLVSQLLNAARNANASDLHIKSNAKPIIRKAGVLYDLDLPVLQADVVQEALLEILTPAQREKFVHTRDIDFCYDSGNGQGRYRTNYLSQHRGIDGIFRVIPNRVPSFEELKLPAQIRKLTEYRQGIVLITGPKGCGKTTTLAALVDLINSTRQEHIITIEDPIEFVHPCKLGHVNQREVGPHTLTFANALRAALREAPDVIMVGEMRDLETTSLAITAAETGHLVFATLHTPDAVRTIGRVLDVFPPKEQGQIRAMFSESLRGIVSQILVPNIAGGGMELAVEIMFNTSAIANIIRENRAFQLRGTLQTGKKLGMIIMDESLINLAKEKRISKQEAILNAENVGFVERELAHLG